MTKADTVETSLLLLNGGVGQRSQLDYPKQFFEVRGHPIMAYAIIAAQELSAIKEIIVNTPKGYETRTKEIMDHYCSHLPYTMVSGGLNRQGSMLKLAEAAQYDQVLVHETARPVITEATYNDLLVREEKNIGYFADIPFSMCRLDPNSKSLSKGVCRNQVFNIQLPQKFDRKTLLKAHKVAKKNKKIFTEDAVMVHEMTGSVVHALPGDHRNIKVTTPKDLALVTQLIGSGA